MITIVILKKINFTILLCIVYIFFIGYGSDNRHSSKLIAVWYGNLRDGGIILYLPLSASYQRSKEGNCIRFIWKDKKGQEYAFIVIIVHEKSYKSHSKVIEYIKLGRKNRGWRLIEEKAYQTTNGYLGKRMLFRKGKRLTEWIYFPFKSYPGGVVIYWSSTEKRYNIDRKVIDSFIKNVKLIHPIVPKVKEKEI